MMTVHSQDARRHEGQNALAGDDSILTRSPVAAGLLCRGIGHDYSIRSWHCSDEGSFYVNGSVNVWRPFLQRMSTSQVTSVHTVTTAYLMGYNYVSPLCPV